MQCHLTNRRISRSLDRIELAPCSECLQFLSRAGYKAASEPLLQAN